MAPKSLTTNILAVVTVLVAAYLFHDVLHHQPSSALRSLESLGAEQLEASPSHK